MSIYETPSTPKALARYLLTYMGHDESTIIAHVKRDFGVILDSKDLARIKRDMPRKYIQGRASQARANPLARQLFRSCP